LLAILALAMTQMGIGPSRKKGKGTPPKVQETVGDLSFVVSRGEMKVEGVGLVVGLDNTGADAPPSWQRKQLVDEMSKAGVEKAEKLLANPAVSMVIVRLTIPIGVSPKDRLDVQVEIPPACGTKSLAGGFLLMTRLREVMLAGGAPRGGPEVALAQGSVMIGTPTRPNDPKVGRVLGGGRVKKDFPYTLVIKENRESVRTSKMLETVVNERFHQTEDGHQKGAATAKTPSYLELKVPALYHQNQERFFRVVQSLQMIDTPELRARRIAVWATDLLEPHTAGVAALKLEGVGSAGVEPLQAALKSPNPQVRFFGAEALAYLNDTAGVETLGETVIQEPKFRPYALAALAALDQPAAHLKLRSLMDVPSVDVRYGAFNALRTLDPHDPFLGLLRVLDEPKRDDDDLGDSSDSLAIAIGNAFRRRSTPDDPFFLYVVDSEGPPLVHISRTRRSEIVIFGRQQKLLPPIVLGNGPILLNASDNDDKIEVSKIVPSRFGDRDVKLTASLELAEVIRRMANIGATYPDIVAVLETAERQKNLAGELIVDAMPTANRMYLEAILGKDVTAKHDDAVQRTSAGKSRPGRSWLRGILRRDEEPSAKNPTTTRPVRDATASPDPGAPPSAASSQRNGQSPGADPQRGADAKKGVDSPDARTPPRDDALEKATAEQVTRPRRRFFDFFRGSDEP
jgi:flagellar basal body P-ring protein FlgI